MSYYITVKSIFPKGQPAKAEIHCGGIDRGFTDENTGELTFSVKSNDYYDISAKRHGSKTRGRVKGGEKIILRLEE